MGWGALPLPTNLKRSDPTGGTHESNLTMTYPIRTRAERARLHIAMLEALPQTPEAEAFAEAIAWANSDEIADLGTLFSLSDAIDYNVAHTVHHSDCRCAEVNADELRKVHGAPTVNLALKLAGYGPRQRGRQMIWTDAPSDGRTRAVPVMLPADLLEQWNAE